MIDRELVEKVNDAMTKLYAYAQRGPYEKELEAFIAQEGGNDINTKEKFIEIIQAFIFDHKLKNHKKLLECFLRESGIPNDDEIEFLKDWKTSIHAIFKIKKVGKDCFHCYNLVNEKDYTIKTITNFLNFKSLGVNDYIFCRVVPLEDFHILVGNLISFPMKSKKEMLEMAVMVQLENSMELYKDNPEKLKEIHENNEIRFQKFYDLFGKDRIYTNGKNLNEVISVYTEFIEFGTADKSKLNGKLQKAKEFYFEEIEELEDQINNPATYFSSFEKIHDVGIIFDRKEGLFILPYYATFTEIFSNPNFEEIKGYKDCVLLYLEDDAISPLPFVKVTTENETNSIKVFEAVLEQENFSIEKDFDNLMKAYKYDYIYNNKVSQTVIYDQSKAFKDLLEEYESLAEDLSVMTDEFTRIGRNDPCPCGSEKKFKKCCLNKMP